MAHHTWAEVPRVLARRAGREKFDASAAERIWWHSYVDVIRFVPGGACHPPILLVTDLASLDGPVRGTVELPLRLFWSSPDRAFRPG